MSIIVTGVLSFGVFCGLTYIGVKICQLACFTLPQQQQQQQQQPCALLLLESSSDVLLQLPELIR